MLKKNILIAVAVTIGTIGMTDVSAMGNYKWGFDNDDQSQSSQASQNYTYSQNSQSQNYTYGMKKYYSRYSTKKLYSTNNYTTVASNRSYSYSSQGPANARGTFIFDPKKLSWAVYNSSGSLVRTGAASGGRGYCPDVHRGCHTPVGRFTVYSKGPANCKSSKFPVAHPGAPMPYCMFFHGGYAIHGSNDVPNYNASHGCIRLVPSDALWLHQNFIKAGTRVVVLPYRS